MRGVWGGHSLALATWGASLAASMRVILATLLATSSACGFETALGSADASIESIDAPDAPDAPLGSPSLTPEVSDFGTIAVATSSVATTFTVTAKAPTQQLAASITGTDAAEFHIANDGCTGMALAAFASCTLTVTFSPVVASGEKSASLRVTGGGGGDLFSMIHGRSDIPPALAFVTSPTPFGTLGVGFTSAIQTITVRNPGTLATPALVVAKVGSDPTEFTLTSDTCSTAALGPMSTCSFVLAFAPNTVGAKSATIGVSSPTGGVPTLSSAITGTALALTIATVPADFGSAVTGTTTAFTTLMITNVAANSVGPLVTSVAGNHPTDFVFGANACSGVTLLPAQVCTIDVAFKPGVIGARNALVRVMVGSTILVDGVVQGIGAAPDPISISPISYAFTATAVGATSTTETFTLFNTGTVSTGVLARSITGADPTQFGFSLSDTCTGVDVPAAGMCTIDVVFSPTTTGAKSATLSLTSTPGGTHTAALTGTGL